MGEAWRVVLASGEVREVECLYIGTVALAKVYGLRAEGVAVSGQGDNFIEAILDLARDGALRIVEILAPGEPTRAEIAAQLAAVTAERDAEAAARYLAQKDRDTQVDALGHALATLRDSVLDALGAQPHEDAAEVAQRVTRERDEARTALATARREGAEEMRERCAVRCEELAEQESAIARAAEARGDQYSAAIRRDRAIARLQAAADIRTLPLDAPGGAT